MPRSHLRIAAAIAGAALILAACGGGGDSESDASPPASDQVSTEVERTDPPVTDPPATEPPSTEPSTSDAGAKCAMADGQGGFDGVSCTDPHDAEFAGLVAAPDGEVPDDEDVAQLELQFLCADLVGELVGLPTFSFAMDVEYVSAASPGEPYAGEIECWAQVADAPGALTDSIAETNLDTALGDLVPLQEMEIGTCYVNPSEDAINIGTVVACTDEGARLLFGSTDADDGGYPGEDSLVADGFAMCDAIGADYEEEIDLFEYTLIIPEELGWVAFGQRTILCNVPVEFVNAGGADAQLVEIEEPAGFVFGAGDPVCSLQAETESENEVYYESLCGDPHNAELVALIEPPDDNLPADRDDAVILFNELCLAPVEAATEADLFRPGVSIGFNVPGALGEPYEGPIACYATFGSVAWVGSFQDLPLAEILGDQVIIADLSPGDCFIFAEDSFASGYEAPCDEPTVIMSVGSYEAADRPYPPIEELRAERAERCAEVLAASGLVESGAAGDPSSLSGSFPSEGSWNVPGRRFVTCDMEPA